SSGVSYSRFLRPYLIGATLVCLAALVFSMFLAPKASQGFNEFSYTYLKKGRQDRNQNDVYTQINANDYLYVSYFNATEQLGSNFTLEHFEGNELRYKIAASQIKYNESDSTYTLFNFVKRTVGERGDIIEKKTKLDTTFTFTLEDLTPVNYFAETLSFTELNDFIKKEKARGSSQINRYEVVRYKRWSLPVSAYILTIIAVAVSSVKRRGGMGVNLAIGISIGMVFIFFDKVFGTMAEQTSFSPFIATWFPNIVFGILAIFLLRNAKR